MTGSGNYTTLKSISSTSALTWTETLRAGCITPRPVYGTIGYRYLLEGQRVEFALAESAGRTQAVDVEVVP
jgi:hypothetical protein